MTDDERIDRGIRAERLLADEMYTDAYEQVRQAIIATWSDAPLRDKDGHHELKLMLKALADVRSVFERTVTDGKVAADSLKRQSFYEKTKKYMRL